MTIKEDPKQAASAPAEDEIVVEAEPIAVAEPEIAVPAVASAVATGKTPAANATTTTTTTTITATTTATVVSGYKVQLFPSSIMAPGQSYRLVVKHNLWLTGQSSNAEAVMNAETNQPFPIRIQSHPQGKGGTQLVLLASINGVLQPCAVLRKNDPNNPDKFHIFGFVPYTPNQKPSITMKYDVDDRPLYVWGNLVNADGLIPYASKRKFNLMMQNGWQYQIARQGGRMFSGGESAPRKYDIGVSTHQTTVKQRNVHTTTGKKQKGYCTIGQEGQDWKVEIPTSASEHDPGIMVALAFMLDELDRTRHS